jgi:hypothetical protein
MIGLRGSALVDHHISTILNVFLNTTRSKEWVRYGAHPTAASYFVGIAHLTSMCVRCGSYLDRVEEFPTGMRHKQLIYQFFDMPWPLGYVASSLRARALFPLVFGPFACAAGPFASNVFGALSFLCVLASQQHTDAGWRGDPQGP